MTLQRREEKRRELPLSSPSFLINLPFPDIYDKHGNTLTQLMGEEQDVETVARPQIYDVLIFVATPQDGISGRSYPYG